MVLVFFMDGVKYDMMKKHMPFLSSLNTMPLQSDFGYSCACHATMYTSRYVDEHGTWFIWKRGDNSPYKWIEKVPGLKYLNVLPLKLALGKITRKLSKNTSYPGVPCLVNLPLRYWPLFETCDDVMWDDPKWKSDIPNLFSIIKENGIKSSVVALHKDTKPDDAFIEEALVNYDNDQFVYYFIGYTDNIMHAHGEESSEVIAYFKKVDSFIESCYQKAIDARGDTTVVAFSDHGHIDIEEPKVDINDYFTPEGLNVNQFVHLIEANFARFWFDNEGDEEKIMPVLRKMGEAGLGFILSQDYLDKYHLNLDKSQHGNITFYLAAPKEFTNTIWGFGKSVKSGHGFEPTLPKHYGIFCCNRELRRDRDFAYLTDFLPTVLAQLGIDSSRYVMRGTNLIDEERDEQV